MGLAQQLQHQVQQQQQAVIRGHYRSGHLWDLNKIFTTATTAAAAAGPTTAARSDWDFATVTTRGRHWTWATAKAAAGRDWVLTTATAAGPIHQQLDDDVSSAPVSIKWFCTECGKREPGPEQLVRTKFGPWWLIILCDCGMKGFLSPPRAPGHSLTFFFRRMRKGFKLALYVRVVAPVEPHMMTHFLFFNFQKDYIILPTNFSFVRCFSVI